MGGKTVETITRHPGTGATRRKVAGGIIGATAAVLAGKTLVGATQGGNGEARGKSKTPICHFDDDTGHYAFIQVPVKAGKGHANHTGDVFTDPDGAPVTREYCASLNGVPDPGPDG